MIQTLARDSQFSDTEIYDPRLFGDATPEEVRDGGDTICRRFDEIMEQALPLAQIRIVSAVGEVHCEADADLPPDIHNMIEDALWDAKNGTEIS